MIDSLVVNAAPGEMRIALLDGMQTVEIYHHRSGGISVVGNLYLGRVTRLLAGANGAFIDIGLNRPGFLNAGDARPEAQGPTIPIGRILDEGATVMVQVIRDALHDKGPRLTLRPRLVGRYLVFRPGQRDIEVSRRITEKAERQRLTRLVGEGAEGDNGFTLRSTAVGTDADHILSDMAALRDAWGKTLTARKRGSPPACLWTAPEPLENALIEHPGLRRVIIDDAATLAGTRRLMVGSTALLEYYRAADPIFEHFAVEAALETAFEARVPLASGGAVIIEETNALCAIDIDGGSAAGSGSSLRVNLEAAAVIARQLRLRAIGGIIVIDFLRLTKRGHHRRVIEILAAALADDRDAVAPEGFSKLGLVEMRRRRIRPSLSEVLGEADSTLTPRRNSRPKMKNLETAALNISRAAARAMNSAPPGTALLKVAPAVAAAFTPGLIATLKATVGRTVKPVADPAYQQEDWRIDFQ